MVEFGATPNAPGFDAAMIGRGDLDKVGLSAGLELERDIAFQRRLVAFDREMIVRSPLDRIARDRALGQQGIAGDVLAGDVAGLKQGNGHADFVRALVLLAAGYRQGAHFFWV